MFNQIEPEIFKKICNMLFEYHFLYISSVEQLNRLYNARYCPEAIKSDILDIQENDIYTAEPSFIF